MKKLSLCLYALIVLTAASGVHAQDAIPELPKAKLYSSVSTVRSSCEHRMSIMDGFFSELSNDPNTQGYVVVYPTTSPVWLGKSRANEVRKYMKRRGMDPGRVTIMEGSSQGDAQTEYWIVPPGAESPQLKETDGVVNAGPMDQITQPKNFTEQNPDHCLWGELYLEEYATEMNFGWEYPGKIIVYSKNLAGFQKRKRELTAELTKYNVQAKRLTFLRKVARNGEEWVELWILPVKKGTKPAIEPPPEM